MKETKKETKTKKVTAEELSALYSAGRIIILPCAPGSTIYKVRASEGTEGHIEPCCMGTSQIVENIPFFGTTYFTDFTLAKAAISKKEEKNA